MKQLTLIGGPMGVGKTAVCRRLMEQLAPAAFLDGDWCWCMSPFVVNDETKSMVKDNIVSVLNRYLQSPELDHVLVGWVLHQEDIIQEIISRLNTDSVKVNIIHLFAVSRPCVPGWNGISARACGRQMWWDVPLTGWLAVSSCRTPRCGQMT